MRKAQSVKNHGEESLVEAIQKNLPSPSSRVSVGIGDDAAALRLENSNEQLLFCSDAMAEGIHFDLRFSKPEDLGWKSIASCMSDIAAMRGKPLAAVVSIALPESPHAMSAQEFLERFYRGAKDLALKFEFDIVGGDLSKSRAGIFIDVACTGLTEAPALRSAARAGHIIAISGTPGKSAAGLHALMNEGFNRESDNAYINNLIQCHLRPQPRFDLHKNLDPRHLGAMIDTSDGLSTELHRIADASKVGFEIEKDQIPIDADLARLAQLSKLDAFEWILNGGEDYQLLITFDANQPLPAGFTRIGRILDQTNERLIASSQGKTPLERKGYDHFK